MRCFYPNPPEPDLSIVKAIKELKWSWQPRFWFVENTLPSRRWLTQEFGSVRAILPGHAIWSNMLVLLPNTKPHKTEVSEAGKRWYERRFAEGKANTRRPFGTGHAAGGKGAAEIAKIPYEIGDTICRAMEQRSGINARLAT
jgi:hypothetical protein